MAVKVYDSIDDASELKRTAEKDLQTLSTPSIEYEATVIDLKSYGMDFEGVAIGDTVRIRDKELGLALTGRVMELEIDLDGEEETKIKLGNIREGLDNRLAGMEKTLARISLKEGTLDALANHKTFVDMVVQGLNDAFKTSANYVRFSPEEGMIFTDNPDESKAKWAINIGSMGFRIAAGKMPNGQWNWRTFGTGNGFTADLIRAGVIDGGSFHLNLETGTLDIGDSLHYDPQGGLVLSSGVRKSLKGDPGPQGPPGSAISKVWVEYGSSEDKSAIPTEWSKTVPEVTGEGVIWRRIVLEDEQGKVLFTDPESLTDSQIKQAIEEAKADTQGRLEDSLDVAKVYADGIATDIERKLAQAYQAYVEEKIDGLNKGWSELVSDQIRDIEARLQDQESYLWMDGGNLYLGRKGEMVALTITPEQIAFLVQASKRGIFDSENLIVANSRMRLLEFFEDVESQRPLYQWTTRKVKGQAHLTLYYVGE